MFRTIKGVQPLAARNRSNVVSITNQTRSLSSIASTGSLIRARTGSLIRAQRTRISPFAVPLTTQATRSFSAYNSQGDQAGWSTVDKINGQKYPDGYLVLEDGTRLQGQ